MDILEMILRTLNSINVAGKENMSRLLGCITALEEYIEEEREGNG